MRIAMTRRKLFLVLWSLLLVSVAVSAQTSTPFTWTAQDALGRRIGTSEQYGPHRNGKTVGMFFVIWHGAHGYDRYETLPDMDVLTPRPNDTLSPYDIQKLLDADPQHPKYGPVGAFHHWGEPYLGYYVANDEWVIRKHAQMLTDAGVDVIIFDMTNEVIYLPIVKKILDTYRKIREEGNDTPQISCLFHTLLPNGKETLKKMYDNIYSKGLYEELWFRWEGKPLVFCPREALTPEMDAFFTTRHCWFDSREPWFRDGHKCCPWADYYPQGYGWDEDPQKAEMVSVAPATHPTDRKDGVRRVGRSFHDGKQPLTKAEQRSGEGLHFNEQFSRAMELDPEFIFFTGWNEWSAMRFINRGEILTLADNECKIGDSYFCDDYNHEYSRDLEPLRGDFGDNYYYQLCDFIRRYKGVDPVKPYTKRHKIDMEDFSCWETVESSFTDDRGDTFHRDHFGYGRIGRLTNVTGRNDIVEAKVAHDGRTIWFYVRTQDPLSPRTDKKWMRLFIDVQGNELGNWEGFQYRINDQCGPHQTTLEKSTNGWHWTKIADLDYRCEANELVIAIPMEAIHIDDPKRFSLEFKWIDNAVEEGDIQECLSDGDAAPNGRFRYNYRFLKTS